MISETNGDPPGSSIEYPATRSLAKFRNVSIIKPNIKLEENAGIY
jgi:hypothetical protein